MAFHGYVGMPVPADQRWFWNDRWQEREREVDAHVSAGDITVYADGDALLDHLGQLDTEPPQATR